VLALVTNDRERRFLERRLPELDQLSTLNAQLSTLMRLSVPPRLASITIRHSAALMRFESG